MSNALRAASRSSNQALKVNHFDRWGFSSYRARSPVYLCQRYTSSFAKPAPTINSERLWNDIHHVAQWGKGERWGSEEFDVGMSRLALSETDRQARDWFVETTKGLGCEVKIDEMGNIFAIRKGRRQGPPTYAGSHLDTQPNGGRYDGILGVCAGLEILKALNDVNFESEFPIGVINWTNEEGARFPISMVSSGVWADKIPLSRAHGLQEVGSHAGKRTIKEELERIGYLGILKANYNANPIGAHFELHIEQGPILEAQARKIGIVQGVQAYRWHTIEVKGRDCHTGTTDFKNRSDAMLMAARLILHSHRLASVYGCLASTGILTLKPGSTNTVPGLVKFSLDIRANDDELLSRYEKELKRDFTDIASNAERQHLSYLGYVGKACNVEWTLDFSTKATRFDKRCIDCVEESVEEIFGVDYRSASLAMTSGAGHDSVYTSQRVPTTMIFAPCREGISHNPAEYCGPEDCANGTQVLMGAMLKYDKLRLQDENVATR